MKIESLYIYPVKSFPAIEIKSSKFDKDGMQYDRNFIMYDSRGEMQTRRNCEGMAGFKMNIEDDHLILESLRTRDHISIPFKSDTKRAKSLIIWDRVEQGFSNPGLVNQFLSEHFEKKVELYSIKKTRSGYSAFHDASPFLVCNRSSVRFLEIKTGKEIDIMRFRPNIILDSKTEFDEKNWKKINIDEQPFHAVKLSGRCIIINQDPLTSVKDLNLLKLIKPYTYENFSIKFGLYIRPELPGLIAAGSSFEITGQAIDQTY
ncbi:MAG: MOSC N-terminal beta barrel domain-containing protein [Saprospiraceae bacterium]